jgi:uncharacterized DUF497 family protein
MASGSRLRRQSLTILCSGRGLIVRWMAKIDGRRLERWQTRRAVGGVLIVLVVHTILNEGDVELIRIISARRVEPHERRLYEYGDL